MSPDGRFAYVIVGRARVHVFALPAAVVRPRAPRPKRDEELEKAAVAALELRFGKGAGRGAKNGAGAEAGGGDDDDEDDEDDEDDRLGAIQALLDEDACEGEEASAVLARLLALTQARGSRSSPSARSARSAGNHADRKAEEKDAKEVEDDEEEDEDDEEDEDEEEEERQRRAILKFIRRAPPARWVPSMALAPNFTFLLPQESGAGPSDSSTLSASASASASASLVASGGASGASARVAGVTPFGGLPWVDFVLGHPSNTSVWHGRDSGGGDGDDDDDDDATGGDARDATGSVVRGPGGRASAVGSVLGRGSVVGGARRGAGSVVSMTRGGAGGGGGGAASVVGGSGGGRATSRGTTGAAGAAMVASANAAAVTGAVKSVGRKHPFGGGLTAVPGSDGRPVTMGLALVWCGSAVLHTYHLPIEDVLDSRRIRRATDAKTGGSGGGGGGGGGGVGLGLGAGGSGLTIHVPGSHAKPGSAGGSPRTAAAPATASAPVGKGTVASAASTKPGPTGVPPLSLSATPASAASGALPSQRTGSSSSSSSSSSFNAAVRGVLAAAGIEVIQPVMHAQTSFPAPITAFACVSPSVRELKGSHTASVTNPAAAAAAAATMATAGASATLAVLFDSHAASAFPRAVVGLADGAVLAGVLGIGASPAPAFRLEHTLERHGCAVLTAAVQSLPASPHSAPAPAFEPLTMAGSGSLATLSVASGIVGSHAGPVSGSSTTEGVTAETWVVTMDARGELHVYDWDRILTPIFARRVRGARRVALDLSRPWGLCGGALPAGTLANGRPGASGSTGGASEYDPARDPTRTPCPPFLAAVRRDGSRPWWPLNATSSALSSSSSPSPSPSPSSSPSPSPSSSSSSPSSLSVAPPGSCACPLIRFFDNSSVAAVLSWDLPADVDADPGADRPAGDVLRVPLASPIPSLTLHEVRSGRVLSAYRLKDPPVRFQASAPADTSSSSSSSSSPSDTDDVTGIAEPEPASARSPTAASRAARSAAAADLSASILRQETQWALAGATLATAGTWASEVETESTTTRPSSGSGSGSGRPGHGDGPVDEFHEEDEVRSDAGSEDVLGDSDDEEDQRAPKRLPRGSTRVRPVPSSFGFSFRSEPASRAVRPGAEPPRRTGPWTRVAVILEEEVVYHASTASPTRGSSAADEYAGVFGSGGSFASAHGASAGAGVGAGGSSSFRVGDGSNTSSRATSPNRGALSSAHGLTKPAGDRASPRARDRLRSDSSTSGHAGRPRVESVSKQVRLHGSVEEALRGPPGSVSGGSLPSGTHGASPPGSPVKRGGGGGGGAGSGASTTGAAAGPLATLAAGGHDSLAEAMGAVAAAAASGHAALRGQSSSLVLAFDELRRVSRDSTQARMARRHLALAGALGVQSTPK